MAKRGARPGIGFTVSATLGHLGGRVTGEVQELLSEQFTLMDEDGHTWFIFYKDDWKQED